MPIEQGYTTRDGERRGYYRWGSHGKMYTYTPGNERSRKAARAKAVKQMRAAFASGYRG